MTIREISTQLYNLSRPHIINGEAVSRRWIENYIRGMFRDGASLKLNNRLAMMIVLNDGEWLMTVDRWADSPDGFDYYIPDTREQEARLWADLTA